jgi:Tol biopolymer transport system component
MDDVREVFEMVTKQTEPDLGSWNDQERHQRTRARRRRYGAFVVVAALAVAGGVAFILQVDDATSGVAEQPTPTSAPPFIDASTYIGFIDLTTGDMSRISIIPSSSGIDVSPDGTQIAYVSNGFVNVADIDGSNDRALEGTGPDQDVTGARWSPDGTSIVYQGSELAPSIGNLYVVDVSSGRVRQISDTEGVETTGLSYMAPTFDPSGSTVLFTMPSGEGDQQRWDLWSVPATGGEPTLVRRNATFGDYSPDGSQIAFVGDGGFADLWVAPSTGGKAQKLATGEIVVPRWSPDGTRIAYNDGSGGVYVVDVGTEGKGLVLGSGRLPEWVDDDTLSLTP